MTRGITIKIAVALGLIAIIACSVWLWPRPSPPVGVGETTTGELTLRSSDKKAFTIIEAKATTSAIAIRGLRLKQPAVSHSLIVEFTPDEGTKEGPGTASLAVRTDPGGVLTVSCRYLVKNRGQEAKASTK